MLESVLKGMRVIDLTQNVAGPFCTQILGELGAEVIKVERPDGGDDTRSWQPPSIGGESSTFLALNRNKKSVCIDISTPEGQRIIARMAGEADIVIHSMRPGSAEKRSLGYEDLRQANPRLIYCAISAFGETGPLRDLPGYDPLMQAFCGILSVTGNEDDDPVRVSVSLIDMGTGIWAALGILAAVIGRHSSGQGARVTASLLETGVSWMSVFVASYFATGVLPRKLGSRMAMTAPYELFRTGDGHVFIGAGNDRLFARICEALALEDVSLDERFSTNARRVENRTALHKAIERITAQMRAADVVAALRAVGAPCSELNDIGQAVVHPQVEAVGMIGNLPVRAAKGHRITELPISLDGRRSLAKSPPPALGEHTTEVLQALRFDAGEIADLKARRILA
jgi:crotonobetainyl-CoA:carnitine CoA-transferase CaiB-like acyl-CoA transferase